MLNVSALIRAVVSHAGIERHQANGAERRERADERDPSQDALFRGAEERIRDHDDDAEEAQHDFRREAMQVRELLGGELDHGCTVRAAMEASACVIRWQAPSAGALRRRQDHLLPVG